MASLSLISVSEEYSPLLQLNYNTSKTILQYKVMNFYKLAFFSEMILCIITKGFFREKVDNS